MNEHFFIYNNKYFRSHEPVVTVSNRGFRFGDGLFETMRMYDGRILNVDFHFERLFHGMNMLQFQKPQHFCQEYLINGVNKLLLKNFILKNARIRIMVFRSDGNFYDVENNSPDYIIETFALNDKIELNQNGLAIDFFSGAKKSCDAFSNLKSTNALPSVMSRLFAKNNHVDDAVILNSFDRICESSIANIFIIKGERIFTPPLSEGCIAGTFRRYLIEKRFVKKYTISEKIISKKHLLDADEVFLTNSIQPIRWVKNCREKNYENLIIKEIFEPTMKEFLKK